METIRKILMEAWMTGRHVKAEFGDGEKCYGRVLAVDTAHNCFVFARDDDKKHRHHTVGDLFSMSMVMDEPEKKQGRAKERLAEAHMNDLVEAAANVCDFSVPPGASSDAIERLASCLRAMGKLNSQKAKGNDEPLDVAKERWEVVRTQDDYHMDSTHGRYIDLGDNIPYNAACEMAAASQMLEVLEAVAKGSSVIKIGDENVTILVPGLLLGINEVIKKARGD